jgi:hypothetical protein
VRDVQVADLLVLGVEIGLGALFGCTGAMQTPPARRECPGSVRSNATAASYLNASPVGVPDVSGTATGQTLNYTQSLTTVTDRSQVVAMIENAHCRAKVFRLALPFAEPCSTAARVWSTATALLPRRDRRVSA